jgi:hypothetical protein
MHNLVLFIFRFAQWYTVHTLQLVFRTPYSCDSSLLMCASQAFAFPTVRWLSLCIHHCEVPLCPADAYLGCFQCPSLLLLLWTHMQTPPYVSGVRSNLVLSRWLREVGLGPRWVSGVLGRPGSGPDPFQPEQICFCACWPGVLFNFVWKMDST